jgi:hypothetical protein
MFTRTISSFPGRPLDGTEKPEGGKDPRSRDERNDQSGDGGEIRRLRVAAPGPGVNLPATGLLVQVVLQDDGGGDPVHHASLFALHAASRINSSASFVERVRPRR